MLTPVRWNPYLPKADVGFLLIKQDACYMIGLSNAALNLDQVQVQKLIGVPTI